MRKKVHNQNKKIYIAQKDLLILYFVFSIYTAHYAVGVAQPNFFVWDF